MKALVIVISALIFVVGVIIANIPIYTIPDFYKLPFITILCVLVMVITTCTVTGYLTELFYGWFKSHIK